MKSYSLEARFCTVLALYSFRVIFNITYIFYLTIEGRMLLENK